MERNPLVEEHRKFNPKKHLRHFAELEWEPMYDDQGQPLSGIRGKSGASEIGSDGHEIGADLIEMQPGSAFPLHTHPGDHILYAVAGAGTVTISEHVYPFPAGATFYIAAEAPHNVGTYKEAEEPFVLLAIGHPQKHVGSLDRMTVIRE